MQVTDPRESEIPSIGLIHIQDPETGKVLLMDTGTKYFRKKYMEHQLAWQDGVEAYLKRSGASVMRISTDRDPVLDVVQFFSHRKGLS